MNRNVVNCPKERYYFGPSKYLTRRISLKSNVNRKLDFSIEGGQTLAEPIRISSVVWNSDAYAKGLRPNDQILSVNGISFENLSLSQANQVRFLGSRDLVSIVFFCLLYKDSSFIR